MSASGLSTNPTTQVAASRVLIAGLVAVIASVLANLLVRALLLAVMDLPQAFPPLMPGAIVVVTTIGVVLATIVYAIVARLSKNPVRTYLIVAFVALIVSILPNFGLMANPASAPFPGGTPAAFGALIVFHVVAAVVSVAVLIGMTRRP